MKKAIIVVSFGTSYEEALKNSIETTENMIKEEFKEYSHFRAFTSHMIIRKILKVRGEKINTPEETLENLYKEGYEEVIIQPLHIISGEEFDYVRHVAESYKEKFRKISVGRPILYYQGVENVAEDYSMFIDSIKDVIDGHEGVILFGHGTAHPCGAAYGCLQAVIQEEGYDNVFVGTVEGYPSFESVLKRIKRQNIKEVLLMPIMVVCGDHALNDMASDEEDSWKTMLEKEGVKVNLFLKGLGEIENFRNLYVQRIHDSINGTYEGVGKTKKGKKKHENIGAVI